MYEIRFVGAGNFGKTHLSQMVIKANLDCDTTAKEITRQFYGDFDLLLDLEKELMLAHAQGISDGRMLEREDELRSRPQVPGKKPKWAEAGRINPFPKDLETNAPRGNRKEPVIPYENL